MNTPMIYPSLDSVLNVLTSQEFKSNPDVIRLLQIYNDVHHKEKGRSGEGHQQYPFIVIEGLDASGKTTVARRLAEKIDADTCDTLREHVYQLREAFTNNKQLCTAFYALVNYITAMQISNTLKERPVVMDRYWHSTTAFGIARAVHSNPEEYKVPPYGDEMYNWPPDLLKPNIVLFVSVRESVRLRRYAARNTSTDEEELLKHDKGYKRNVIIAHNNIMGPILEYIDGNLPKDYVCNEAFEKIKHLFNEQQLLQIHRPVSVVQKLTS